MRRAVHHGAAAVLEFRSRSYAASMRTTDFWRRMADQFGAVYADSVARDQVLSTLGSRTVHQALSDGDDVKDVWRAVCVHFDVPARDR